MVIIPDLSLSFKYSSRPATEDEMVGWHHRLNGQEFEQTPGDSEAWCAVVHGASKSQVLLSN